MSMMKSGIEFHGDAPDEVYEVLKRGVQLVKGVSGLTCEIGVREGLGSISIMEACQANDDKRIHIGIDPWGNIEYDVNGVDRRIDYTNNMKRLALKNLYDWCFINEQEFIAFAMRDLEFFELFANGVPVHEQESSLVNEYAYVFVDGPHNETTVQVTIDFFESRSPIGAVWQFDNTNLYPHGSSHERILSHGFIDITEEMGASGASCKKSYQRKS